VLTAKQANRWPPGSVNRRQARGWGILADDQAHALGPRRQVQHARDLGDPRAGSDLALGVIGRLPDPVRELEDGLLHVVGNGEAGRVDQVPSGLARPRTRGVPPPDRCGSAPAPQPAGQLGQGEPDGLDVVADRVRPGVAGPQHDVQRLARAVRSVSAKLAGGSPSSSSTLQQPVPCRSTRSRSSRRGRR
jgi:hypothetical protein